MSATVPDSFVEWLLNIQIPWLTGNANGIADATAWGGVVDTQVGLLKEATKARFTDYAPSDALPHIGGDRKLVQGPTETDDNFRIRLKTAWDDWARAGTWLELLVQLYWAEFDGAIIVQQNGLAYSLSGAPTAGEDPTSLLTITDLSELGTPMHSDVTLSRSIPAGNTWWTFDSDTDFSSRFAILFPGPVLPSWFTTYGTATFTGTEDGSEANPWPTVTWNNPFTDTTYKIQVGAITITDGGGPVVVVADNTTKTPTGVQLESSGSFEGTVQVLAWQAGANPFADLHPADLSRMQFAIRTWRPARATCMGVFALVQGKYFGWPVRTFGSGGVFGPGTVAGFPGA